MPFLFSEVFLFLAQQKQSCFFIQVTSTLMVDGIQTKKQEEIRVLVNVEQTLM